MSVIAGKGVQSKGWQSRTLQFCRRKHILSGRWGAWTTAGEWVLPSPQEQGFGGGGSLKEINKHASAKDEENGETRNEAQWVTAAGAEDRDKGAGCQAEREYINKGAHKS